MSDESPPPADDDPQLATIAERLIRDRPTPSAGFRSALHQRLVALEQRGPLHARPSRFWARVALLAAPGTLLLALVGVGVAGSGPFAP
jgi:hypothetical protein